MATGSVIVTVGTTCFDALIEAATDPVVLKALKDKGYSKLTCQIGNGTVVPNDGISEGVNVTHFRFSDNIKDDYFRSANLVISHAGAGTCLEVLDLGKPLVVVINDALMGNHQIELAEQLQKEGCAYLCSPASLLKTIQSMDVKSLKKFPRGNPKNIADAVHKFIFNTGS